jgi:hypothetical protein
MKIHDDVFEFLKTKNKVWEVKEFSEFPNRYGDNVSSFIVKYNIEDKYNYDLQEIKIEYSTSRVFPRLDAKASSSRSRLTRSF